MLISEFVEVKWYGSNKQYYMNKGYEFTNIGDIFIVKFHDLLPSGSQRILLKCDYQKEGCQNIYDKKVADYYNNNINANIHTDCCKNPKCMKEKRKESLQKTYGCDNSNQIFEAKEKRNKTCQELYGGNSPICSSEIREKSKITLQQKYNVNNISQVEEIKLQKKNTCLEHFGVENQMQSEEVKEKGRKTTFKKYGVQHYAQTNEYKDKTKATNQEKYGVDWYLSLKEPHEKSKKANLKKYGVEYPICLPNIQNKARQTMYKNGTAPCSTQQKYLSNLYNLDLNYFDGNCFLDMVDILNRNYIEYDGGGHNLSVKFENLTQDEFNNKERRRSYALNRKGWKEIRIISRKDKLPQDETLLLMLNYAKDYLNTGHSWIKFNIDNSQIITSQYKINVDFGELRKIKDKDLNNYKQCASL